MNIAMLEKLRDRIADPKVNFSMGSWRTCIAGQACGIIGMKISAAIGGDLALITQEEVDRIISTATMLLDLTDGQRRVLMSLGHWPVEYLRLWRRKDERTAAVAYLNHLIDQERAAQGRPSTRDMAEIDRILEEANAEELVTA